MARKSFYGFAIEYGQAGTVWVGGTPYLKEMFGNHSTVYLMSTKLLSITDPRLLTKLESAARMVETRLPRGGALLIEGNLMAHAIAFLLLYHKYTDIHTAESKLMAFAMQRRRFIDNEFKPIHLFTTPQGSYLLQELKRHAKGLYEITQNITCPLIIERVEPDDVLQSNVTRLNEATKALPREPSHLMRAEAVMGKIHQFEYDYPPAGWACGSIAISACLWSFWSSAHQWQAMTIDSIVHMGLWFARRYTAQNGLDDIMTQVKALCPELSLVTTDVLDLNAMLRDVEKATSPQRFFVTANRRGHAVGHHTFMVYERGMWCWLEPIASSRRTLQYDSERGASILRRLDSSSELKRFVSKFYGQTHVMSIVKVRASRWNNELWKPKPVLNVVTPYRRARDIMFDEVCVTFDNTWNIRHLLLSDGRLQVMQEPVDNVLYLQDFMVHTAVTLHKGSVIHMGSFERVNVKEDPVGHTITVDKHTYNQSMFQDPYLWQMGKGDIKNLIPIGQQGRALLPYVAKSRQSNVEVFSGGDNRLYLLVTRTVFRDTHLKLPRAEK